MRKNYKKLTAIALTVAMTMGSAMTVSAADTTGDTGSGEISGDGSYEGGPMQYPTIQVTLPTTPLGLDYIADPNDLITSTLSSGDAAKDGYKGYDFEGTTGIYFKTKQVSGDPSQGPITGNDRGKYSSTSDSMVFTNKSAKDLNVTVTLAKTSQASGDVVYSETGTFASGDTAKKLYLAITDGTTRKALSASGDATFTTTVNGQVNNFKPGFDSGDATYKYVEKASGDATRVAWNTASYNMEGAINKNAEWADSIGVPNIKVTWSYAEKPANAAPSIATTSYPLTRDQAVEIPVDLGLGNLKATGLSAANFGSNDFLNKTVTFNASTKKITVDTVAVNAMIGMSGNQTITMVFNDTAGTRIPITFTH